METAAERIYTPSELNRDVRRLLEANFCGVVIEGEVSNLSRPASGHQYFSLKDSGAQIRCALFRSAAARQSIRLENGMQVRARGRISLYEPRGDYQLIVERVEDAGEGLLQRQFEELKRKLETEGLFDAERKRPLPRYPQRIALITSPRGAALRDLLHVLARRWPLARVRLYPVPVQGDEAPAAIRRAIRAAGRHGWADTLIVGRGGGSLEDLMAFNDEGVARAVADSPIPVVSAVGHETDFSICDFVADLRAPTPSAAAELATPDRAEVSAAFARWRSQLRRRIEDRLRREAQTLDHLAHRLQQRHPRIRLTEQARRLEECFAALSRALRHDQEKRRLKLDSLKRRLLAQSPARKLQGVSGRIDNLQRALRRAAHATLASRRQKLGQLARTLTAVSPLETIARGYAVITSATGEVISSRSQVSVGDRIAARISDGELDCTVDEIR